MARADLIVKLVRAATKGDPVLVRRVVEAIAAEERANKHQVLATRLEEVLSNGSRGPDASKVPRSATDGKHVFEIVPERDIDDLVLPPEVEQTVRELAEEQHRAELLRSHGIEPRHRVLLLGPPGNGKTSLAEALARELLYPLFVVRYEGVVASYLGETASRLGALFDFVRTRQCVLFFDEFDTLGKERGDIHETGEIKRVVSSLLLQIDRLPSHVVVVTATNHPELLDRAVWRRFQVRLSLPRPDKSGRRLFLKNFFSRTGVSAEYSNEIKCLVDGTEGASFSELEELATDIIRRRLLEDLGSGRRGTIRSRLNQWKAGFTAAREGQNGPTDG